VPPSLNLSRLIQARLTRRRMPWRLAASVLLALSLGGAGGWLLGQRPPSGVAALAQESAASYAVYVADHGRPVELAADQRGDLVRWLTQRLNRPVAPPDLSGAGYRFLGGRLVATARGAAALFVYENDGGARLAVFIRPMGSESSTPIRAADIGDNDGCIWIDNGVGYTVTAAEPYQRLLELSRHVRQQAQTRS
jgi:anti-sigma factor RsiW